MKKLLVVLMVLSMATIANAGLVIGGAPAEMMPSDTALLTIEGIDGGVPGNTSYWAILEGPGTNSGGTLLYSPADQEAGYAFMVQYTDDADGILSWLGGLGYQTANAYFISFGSATSIPADGLLVDGILFHCDAPGDVTLSLVMISGDAGSEVIDVFDTVVIHQIPEPMTMGLLGLGGLFLRRRK